MTISSTTTIIVSCIVAALFLFFIIWGWSKGLLRIVLTTMALIVTIAAASALTPVCSKLIGDSFIGKKVDETVNAYVDKTVTDPIVNTMAPLQEGVISRLPVPGFMKTDISENNTPEEYINLQVSNFTEYLKTRISGYTVRIITYVLLMIVIFIVLRILLGVSKLINKVPVVGFANRFLGALLGIAEALLIVWVAMLVIMLFSGSDFGSKALAVINSSPPLKFLYDNNLVVKGVNALFHSLLG